MTNSTATSRGARGIRAGSARRVRPGAVLAIVLAGQLMAGANTYAVVDGLGDSAIRSGLTFAPAAVSAGWTCGACIRSG